MTDFHQLTRAEIDRQIAVYQGRRDALTKQLAAFYLHAKTPAPPPSQIAARERAKEMLNGAAPAWLTAASLRDTATTEEGLYVERDAIDLVLRHLNDTRLADLAADEARWAKEHAAEWQRRCADFITALLRLDALDRGAEQFLEGHPAAPLTLRRFVGAGRIANLLRDLDMPELLRQAAAEGVVTRREIEKAKNT